MKIVITNDIAIYIKEHYLQHSSKNLELVVPQYSII